MALFGRRQAQRPARPATASTSSGLATAAGLPEPTEDWRSPQAVRAEWADQLEGVEGGRLGWGNGRRMFEEGVVPGQKLNVAEYITRGLAYHLFNPILTDEQAQDAARCVLILIEQTPAEPPYLAAFGPRLSRLALTVIREKGWQPTGLGGDGSITDEILGARTDGLVFYSARCPGVPLDQTWNHFFQSAAGA